MTQQLVRRREVDGRAVERVKARYEADGYAVSFGERLPPPHDDFIADAIARRGDKAILIEIQPNNIHKFKRERLARLNEILESDQSWQLNIETYPVESPPPDPDRDDITRRLEEAKRVADASPEASLMLIWSAVEGALVAICRDQDLPRVRPGRPRALVHDLVIHGVLSDNQFKELDRFAQIRNNIAHGLNSKLPSEDQLDWLIRFALAAAEGEVAAMEDMVEWFTDSESEIRIQAETGRDIRHILRQRFGTALEADITEAAAIIEEESRTSHPVPESDRPLAPSGSTEPSDPTWEQLLQYGQQKARELGIKPEDVEHIVRAYREETAAAQSRDAQSRARSPQ